jgi:hypothetical protein
MVGRHLRPLNVLERNSRPSYEILYSTNTSHRKQETFLDEYPSHWVLLPTEMHNSTLIFGSTCRKRGHHFDYWNEPLNMRILGCYLDCNEAGMCCYLLFHIENLSSPLQLFYFHLWLIYWLCLVLHITWKISSVEVVLLQFILRRFQ